MKKGVVYYVQRLREQPERKDIKNMKNRTYKVIFTEHSKTDNSAYCRFIHAYSRMAIEQYAESCGMKIALCEMLNEWETGCILDKVDFLNENGEMEYHTEQ